MKNIPLTRCAWVSDDPLYRQYHDNEWGKPQRDSQKLFEQLCLEGQQAGLSWITVLKKRESYRTAFFDFNPHRIAQMNDADIENLMQNSGLIRHRAKLASIIKNAQAYLQMEQNGENFSRFIWKFVDNTAHINAIPNMEVIPTQTPISQAMSKALKQRGFTFVGATTCYAFMQAAGLVDDHWDHCFCKTL